MLKWHTVAVATPFNIRPSSNVGVYHVFLENKGKKYKENVS